jgi:hypothetical protein
MKMINVIMLLAIIMMAVIVGCGGPSHNWIELGH